MATGGHQSTCEKRDTPATSVSRCKLELTNAGIEPQPEVSTQLCIFLFEDAPRGHSSVSDFSEGNSTSTESQSLKGHETDPTTVSPVDQEHLAREQADFDGTFQEPQEALSVDSSSSLVVVRVFEVRPPFPVLSFQSQDMFQEQKNPHFRPRLFCWPFSGSDKYHDEKILTQKPRSGNLRISNFAELKNVRHSDC